MKKYNLDIESEAIVPENVKELIFYLVRPFRFKLALFFFITGIGVLFWVASTFVASEIISELGINSKIDSRIWWLVFWYAFMRFFDEIFWRVGELLMRGIKPQMTERLRVSLYKGVTRHSHEYFVNANSGRVAHWINSATDTFNFMADTTVWTVWGRLIGMIIATVFLFTAHWSLAVLFISWLIILFWYNSKRGKKFAELVGKQSDESSIASGLVTDTISNNVSLRVFNSRIAEIENLSKQQDRIIHAWRKSWLHNTVTNMVKGQSASVVSVAALLLALWLFSNGTIGLGALVLFMAYFTDASSSLWQLAWALDSYYRSFGTLQNALGGLKGADERRVEGEEGEIIPSKVKLEIKSLKFAYPERPKENILDDIDITIEPGQKIGVVGHSGAGKSTLVNILLGFYEPASGLIKINNIDLSTKDPSYLRNATSFVPQDTSMFNRTIRENVLYARPNADEDQLIKALKLAQALEFVQKLPKGINTIVGERGVKLSGGQRQRIAIARAILKDSPLLLLDEATSALDSVSEQAIQKALHELMKGRTAVVIAHRLSTLKHLDKIIVLEKGRIVESGSHDELLGNKKGIYADLWKRQKDGFIVE